MAAFRGSNASHILSKYCRHFQNFPARNLPSYPRSHLHYKMYYTSHRYFASTKQQQQQQQSKNTPSSSPMLHHYTTLNIEADANIDDIKKSYNSLIKQWHPDLYASKPVAQQQDAQQKFMLIREAYEIIMDHKQDSQQDSKTTDKADLQKTTAYAQMKRTPHASYSYYSWSRKVYESQQQNTTEEDTESKEEEEQKYSEYYTQNKTWIHKTMEELYDWIVFLYMRNPSWMQFFLIATACFGIVQCVWHLLYPNINDADPDRIWNVSKIKKHKIGVEYQPSTTAAMTSTPNIVALQPHFKGQTLYDNEQKHQDKYDDEDYSDVEKDSAWMMFAKLNLNSTVNRDLFKMGKKKKKETVEKKLEENNEENIVIAQNVEETIDTKSEEIQLKNASVEYNDIPLELRSNPMGLLLASCAADSGDVPKENGKYDWSLVIEKYRKLNTENEKDLQLQCDELSPSNTILTPQ